MKPTAISTATWTERYEAVREHSLHARQIFSADPLGLVLLLKHGLAGWMRRWFADQTEARPLGETPVVPLGPATPVWQQQLTVLLAQMTVSQLFSTARL